MAGETCGSFGINSKIGFVASNAIDGSLATATTRLEILAENFRQADALIGGRGITGSINPVKHHLRQGQQLVQGGLAMDIGPNELAPFIRAICGNSAADQTKESFDLIPFDFTVLRDNVAHGYRYCAMTQAVISGRAYEGGDDREAQIIQMALNFLGVQEHATSFPAINLPSTDRLFWLIADSALDIGGTEYNILDFKITVRNYLQPIFRNSLRPLCFRCTGRRITLDVSVPYSTTAATNLLAANDTDLDVTLELVADNLPSAFDEYSTVFNWPTMRRVDNNHTTAGRGEIPLELTFEAYQSGTNTTMSITNQVTAP